MVLPVLILLLSALFSLIVLAGLYLGIPSFIVSILTSLIGIILAIFFEYQRKPKLQFEIERHPPSLPDGKKFLRLLVHNKPRSNLLQLFLSSNPALQCRAEITFLHENGRPIFGDRVMQGRWAHTPEPVLRRIDALNTSKMTKYQSGKNVFFARDTSSATLYVDIPAHAHDVLDIVMRPQDSKSCFGWHNDYINQPDELLQKYEFCLPSGRYHVLVDVLTQGKHFRQVFTLVNDVNFSNYHLEVQTKCTSVDKLTLITKQNWAVDKLLAYFFHPERLLQRRR